MLIHMTFTDKEAGRLIAALRTLAADHDKRAARARGEALEYHLAARNQVMGDDPDKARGYAAIAEKLQHDQISLAAQARALEERIEAACNDAVGVTGA